MYNNNFTVNNIPYAMIDGELHVLEHERVHRVIKQRKLKLQDRFSSKGYYIAGQFTTLEQINKLIEKQQ